MEESKFRDISELLHYMSSVMNLVSFQAAFNVDKKNYGVEKRASCHRQNDARGKKHSLFTNMLLFTTNS